MYSPYPELRHCLVSGVGSLIFAMSILSASASTSESVILPVVGSQPDTGWQLGVAGFWESAPDEDALAASIFFIGTQRQQFQGTLGGRFPGVLDDKTDYFEAEVYGSLFPNEFYGYRQTFLAEGAGVSYDEETLQLRFGWFYPLTDTWRTGLTGITARSRIAFEDPDSALTQGVNWTEGGQLLGTEISLTRDTRDQPSWPAMGTWSQSALTIAADDDGELFGWGSQSLAAYYRVPRDVIFALGGQVQAATENTPFLYMPTLNGSEWMRGLREGQYRHQTTVTTQAEIRLPITTRFSATTFSHIGQVGATPDEWFDAAWKTGGGLGLRYSVSDVRRQNIRVDMGWVDGRNGLVINFGEAF